MTSVGQDQIVKVSEEKEWLDNKPDSNEAWDILDGGLVLVVFYIQASLVQ